MEAHRNFGKSLKGGQALNNRKTAALVAGISALLAAALIYLFVTHYHKNAPAIVAPQESTVLVARHSIPAGTSEAQLAAGALLEPTHVPQSQVVAGALSDPAIVAGQATSVAIEAGQQVTISDFTKTAANSLTQYLNGSQRGVAFTLDSEHGLTTYLQPYSTVDIMDVDSKTSDVKLLIKNVTIIANTGGLVVLRLTDKQALIVTAATLGQHSLWLTLRPTIKATNSVPVGEVGSVGSF